MPRPNGHAKAEESMSYVQRKVRAAAASVDMLTLRVPRSDHPVNGQRPHNGHGSSR
jgi:hypothetical protein